jgi:hypothetical protein
MNCSTRLTILVSSAAVCAGTFAVPVFAQDTGEMGDLSQFAPHSVGNGPGTGAGLMGGGALGKALGGALNLSRGQAPPSAPATGAVNLYRRRHMPGVTSTGGVGATGTSPTRRPARKSTFVIDAPETGNNRTQPAATEPSKPSPVVVNSGSSQAPVDASDMVFDGQRRAK